MVASLFCDLKKERVMEIADQELRNRDSVVDSRIDVLEFLKSNDCMEMMRREDVKINTFSSSSDLRTD